MTGLRPHPTAVVAAVLFLVLCVLVTVGATRSVDVQVQGLFVPGGRWSHAHQVASDVPDVVSSPRQIIGFLVVASGVAAWRRSLRPLLVAGIVVSVSVAAVAGFKYVVARPDTGGHVSGGSFPSGHMTILVVTVGGLLLIALPRTRAWQWVAASPLWFAAAIPGRTGISAHPPAVPAVHTAR
jgi:membrane-associated phospholipid phosphatase